MRAAEIKIRIDDCFRDRAKQVSSLTRMSLAIGRSRGYLSGALSETGPDLDWEEAMVSLETIGEAMPEEVIHTAISQLDADPVQILLAARERQKGPSDFYFREAGPRLQALIEAGPTPHGEWPRRTGAINRLDKLRRRDRQQAKKKLQELISHALDRLEATGARPRQAFCDLASALCVLASLQRLAGRRNDAMDLLVVARPLSLLANDLVAEGDWLVRAAMLLVDLSRNARAHEFVLEATSQYALAGATTKQAEAAVTRAYVLTHAKNHAKSKRILEHVLPSLEEDQTEIRYFAHQTLAVNFRELGELAEACKHLSVATGLAGDDTVARATCLWTQAKLLEQLGQISTSMTSYREALPLLAKLTGAAELAELAMGYAKLLMRERRRPELQALAADLSGWIQDLRGNKKLRDVIDDFAALINLNELNEAAFLTILKKIQAARAVNLPCTEVPGA
jgi:tetratricopeptide (TPR) repeat protein